MTSPVLEVTAASPALLLLVNAGCENTQAKKQGVKERPHKLFLYFFVKAS